MRTALRSFAAALVLLTLSNAPLQAQRPQVREGFWIGFGFGGGSELTSDGAGLLLGAGYDIRVARNFSLTPVLNFYLSTGGDLEADGITVAEGWKHNVIELALGFTFH